MNLLRNIVMIRWMVLSFLVISLVVRESDASFVTYFRKLGQSHKFQINTAQISPSPAPAPGPADPPQGATLIDETCDTVWYKCPDGLNITACLPSRSIGSHGSIMLVHNYGHNNLKLNISVLPLKHMYDNIEIPRHQVKKMNIPSNIEGSLLNSGNEYCVIHFGAQYPYGKLLSGYATPVNGVYLLFGTIVIIGGTWACCIMTKNKRHLEGVPYQEIEMEQQQKILPYVDPDNWDQSWDDDDWDEEKAVRSPNGSLVRSRKSDGLSPKSTDTDEWGNNWND